MFFLHPPEHLFHDVGMLPGEVVIFVLVGLEVIKLEASLRRFVDHQSDAFPPSHAYGLLPSLFMELPVEPVVFALTTIAGQ